MTAQQNNLTILFVDVSDSTRLYESLGDAAAFREVRECLAIFEEVAASQQGRVIKTIGDGSMCVFPTADAALLAACEMQVRVLQRQALQNHKISIRVGLHHGPVLVDGDDVYGDTVNTASRMAQVAASGQIITTGETVDLLSSAHRSSTRRLDALPVKGKHEAVIVHSVLWQTGSEHTQMPGRIENIPPQADVARLRLTHAGREIIVTTSIGMGRNATNAIALKDTMASRDHARIERRKDKFVLIDQSSNGTFVSMKSGEQYKLQREEMFLHGSGAISFGHSARDKNAEIVGFWFEPMTGKDKSPPANPHGKLS
jgi:class 3 adenylate cyclase